MDEGDDLTATAGHHNAAAFFWLWPGDFLGEMAVEESLKANSRPYPSYCPPSS